MQDPQKTQMNPGDNRNLIIFMVVSALLYFAYDTFVMKPHETAMRQARFEQIQKQALLEGAKPDANIAGLSSASAGQKSTADILKGQDVLTLENDEVAGSISLTGGKINHWQLKSYQKTMDSAEAVEMLSPRGTAHPRGLEFGWVSSDAAIALPNGESKWQITGTNTALTAQTPVTLFWDNSQGLRFERTLTLDENFGLTVQQRVVNNGANPVTLYPYGLISQKGLSADHEERMISHEGPIGYINGELIDPDYKKMRKERTVDVQGAQGWIGITDKYWLTALIPPQGQNVNYRVTYTGTPPKKKQKDTGIYQMDFTGSALTLAPGQEGSVTSHAFVGAKRVLLLKKYNEAFGVEKLDLSVDFGMFWFFTIPFFYGLHYLGLALGNMGLAIIALTLVVRTAVSPLTYSSYKSFAKMKKVMPQVNELKEKYAEDDKEKLQKEMLALYQKEGVNPAAGCFPILLQIPVFFAFYKILFITIEVRHAPFYGWIQDLSAADPTSIFNLFGLLPWDPPSFLMIGVWPCLMLVAMMIQKSLNPPPVDKLQRDMMNFFPIIMTFVMAQFASGLVIYWTISAFFGNVQQIVIMRKMGVPIHLFGEKEEEKTAEAPAAIEAPKPQKKEPEVIENITPPKRKKKKKK